MSSTPVDRPVVAAPGHREFEDERRATSEGEGRAASEDDLPELFLHVTKRLRRAQSARLSPLGLTPAQARALRIIGRADEHGDRPLRMSALAEHLGIVPRSATTVVDALVAAELVARQPDPANRRATLVTPTGAGRRALAQMSEARRDAAGEMFAALSPDQRDTLRALLAALLATEPAAPESGC